MSSDEKIQRAAGDGLAERLLQRALHGEALAVEALLRASPELGEAERARLRALAETLAVDGTRSFGHFELVRELGRGGQGTVFLARDSRLSRNVALKVLNSAELLPSARPTARGGSQRLRREAEIAAKLDHAGICPVYEIGVEGGHPFIAMRYVEGETLARRLEAAHGSLLPLPATDTGSGSARRELARIVELVERVAHILHAAHESQVVHRDIKPANLMITPQGEPVILDFGMARDQDSDAATLSASGELIGSPAYMAPEQIDSARGAVDAQTDVYALGVVLYECLTRVRPFDAPTLQGLQRAILDAPAPDVRDLRPALPRDLAVVLATALEKDKSRRYQSALAFAEDLRRVREHEPILARPAGAWLRLRRWAQRNPGLAVGVGVAFLALFVVAIQARISARRSAAEALFANALAKSATNPAAALRLEIEAADTGEIARARIDAQLVSELAALHEVRRLQTHEVRGAALFASRDGSVLATTGWDHCVRLYDGLTLEPLGTSAPLPQLAAAPDVALSPDGTWLAFQSEADAPRLLCTRSGTTRTLGPIDRYHAFAFAPDSRRLARVRAGGITLSWCDGSHADAEIPCPEGVDGLALGWSPDGRWLWRSSIFGTGLMLLDSQGRVTRQRFESAPMVAPQFAPASSTVWFGRGERLLDLDLDSDAPPAEFTLGPDPPAEDIVSVRLDHAGRHALLCWKSGGARILDLARQGYGLALGSGRGRVSSAEFSDDDRRLVLLGEDGQAHVYECSTGLRICDLASDDAAVAVAWNATDPRAPLITTHASGQLRRWALTDAISKDDVHFPGNIPDAHGCDVRDGLLAVGAGDTIHLLDLETHAQRREFTHAGAKFRWIDLDPAGKRLAAACADDEVLVFAIDSPAPARALHYVDPESAWNGVWVAQFSPDGRWLASAGENGRIRMYDTRSWELDFELRASAKGLRCLGFDARGERLVSVSETEGVVRLWSLSERRPLAQCRIAGNTLAANQAPIDACFSPTGSTIAISGWDGKLYLWNPDEGPPHLIDLGAQEQDRVRLNDLAFLPDGERIAIATDRGEVWLVSVREERILTRYRGPGPELRSLDLALAHNRIVAQELSTNIVRSFPLDPLEAARGAWSLLEHGR